MTVLLVDDQLSILSGLISGINWDALGVTAIRTAGNAAQAKKILESEPVDVMLCDIEMPGENGLALLRWTRSRGMDLVCVFLTSHADFLYAKEAIQLNCFDYILQPARYEEIQATVAKAISRVRSSRKEKELEYYGIYAKNQPGGAFQNIFNSWMAGDPLPVSRLQAILRHFHKGLSASCDCALVIGQLLRWRAEPWTTAEWNYGLNNIFVELFEESGIEVLPFSLDITSLGWFLYAREQSFSSAQKPLQVLESVYLRVAQYFPCDFAFYLGSAVPVSEATPQAKKLLKLKQDNVLQKSGVFPLENSVPPEDMPTGPDTVQVARWKELLGEGQGPVLQEEFFHFLDELSGEKQVDYQFLQSVWRQFQQVVLNLVWERRMDSRELLPAIEQGERAQSLIDVKDAVAKISAAFSQASAQKDSKTVIQQVEQYIQEHLDSPLTVGDVANAMFMNPDYLSRLFKNEHSVALKEYIVAQKMHAAQVLLQTTALPVGVIASKVGYDNYSYFSQAYKKATGCTPSEERK